MFELYYKFHKSPIILYYNLIQKFYKIRRDLVFKTIFENKKNWDLLKRLIEEVIHEEVEVERILLSELNNDRVRIRRKVLDVIVKTKKDRINIEINSSNYNYFKRRNAAFIFKLYSDSLDSGESYNDMERIIQINLSVEQENTSHFPLISEYTLHDKYLNRDYIDNLKIYEINITEMARLCYNGEKEMCLLGMLDMDYEELVDIKGDKYMDKLKKEAIKVNSDDEMIKLMSDEDEERLYVNTLKEIGKEEGIKEYTIEMVKKMLDKKFDIELISELSGLSKEEIEKIIKEK